MKSIMITATEALEIANENKENAFVTILQMIEDASTRGKTESYQSYISPENEAKLKALGYYIDGGILSRTISWAPRPKTSTVMIISVTDSDMLFKGIGGELLLDIEKTAITPDDIRKAVRDSLEKLLEPYKI